MRSKELISQYTNSWVTGNLDKLHDVLAKDLDFQGSLMTFNSSAAFIDAMKGFTNVAEGQKEIASFYEDDKGILLYDVLLKGGKTLRCSEYFEIEKNKIARMRLVFDSAQMAIPDCPSKQ